MRIKLLISYDGTNYFGYQKQPNQKTIQSELEKAISKIVKNKTKTFASGRTDANVHAKGQVVHFDSDLLIEEKKWENAINTNLPEDIRVLKVEFVNDDFHARFSAVKKEYRYYINIGDYDVFTNRYSLKMFNLNIEKMKEAIKYFEGKHDFTSFSYYVEDKPTSKEIFKADINFIDNIIEIIFIGNGFLKYMVRVMVGTLIEIGLEKRKPEEIKNILAAKERKKAGQTASAKGLILHKVYY